MTLNARETLSAKPPGTGSVGTRVIGAVSVVGAVSLYTLAIFVTADEVQMGDAYRPVYVHVPTVTAAYLLFILNAVGSAMWLWKRSKFWDNLAAASAEIGALALGLTLITGALWGRITWGIFWDWDPRLTMTAVLFLAYIGYLALRAATVDSGARATRSAVVGLCAVLIVPIVNKSVDWWRSLHQRRTLSLDTQMEGLQLFTLMFGLLVGLICALWLLFHRFRLEHLRSVAEASRLQQAIEDRTSLETEASRATQAPQKADAG